MCLQSVSITIKVPKESSADNIDAQYNCERY